MPVSSSSSSPLPRAPSFLSSAGTRANAGGGVGQASFGGSAKVGAKPRIVPFFERAEAETPAGAQAEVPAMEPPPGIEPLAPPLPPPTAQPSREMSERLARAIRELGAASERLGEQAASDALEIALLVARRIIDAELTSSTAALPALIRSALRRLGETRRIIVRVCPADAAILEAATGEDAPGSLAAAPIEIRADGSLSLGDCVVDDDESAVDGRLGTRVDEVRRALLAALAEPDQEPPR